MKTLWAMLGALLSSVLIMELGLIFTTYNKMYAGLEHALDAALVAGIREQDAMYGRIYIDSEIAQAVAEETFRENLGLDRNLENLVMKNTDFLLIINQDGNGARPFLAGTARTEIAITSPTLFGQPTIPIKVEKTQHHMATYN